MLVQCHPRRNAFSPFFEDFFRADMPTQETDLTLRCDVLERQNDYVIYAEIPGVPKESVKVEIQDHLLTISGEKKMQERVEGERYNRTERRYGSFSRSFRVGDEVDASKIQAGYHDGVLEVILPKSEKAQPRTVDIRVN